MTSPQTIDLPPSPSPGTPEEGRGGGLLPAFAYWRFPGLALLCLLAAACVDEKKEVATYRKVLDGPHPTTVPSDYSHGEPLTLEAALLLANRDQDQLAIQGEQYLQSLIARERAYGAFIPNLSLQPTLEAQNKALAGTGRHHALDVPLVGSANIFNGFRDVSTLNAAKATVEQQRDLLLDLQAAVLLDTAQTYYQIILAERSVDVLVVSSKLQDARVADMRRRLGAGIAMPLDVAQSEAQAAATRVLLVSARSAVQTGRVTLAQLTVADVEGATLVDRLIVPNAIPSLDDAMKTAQTDRLDLAAAIANVEIQRQNARNAVDEYYPSVSASLDYYLHKESAPALEWAGLISANIPIFSGPSINDDVRAALSKLRQAVSQRSQLFLQIRHDVETDLDNLDASNRRIVELQTELKAAQDAYDQSVRLYKVGLAVNLDVLTAQDTLLSTQLSLVTEQFNYKMLYLSFMRLVGQFPLPTGVYSMNPASRPSTQPATMPGTPPSPEN